MRRIHAEKSLQLRRFLRAKKFVRRKIWEWKVCEVEDLCERKVWKVCKFVSFSGRKFTSDAKVSLRWGESLSCRRFCEVENFYGIKFCAKEYLWRRRFFQEGKFTWSKISQNEKFVSGETRDVKDFSWGKFARWIFCAVKSSRVTRDVSLRCRLFFENKSCRRFILEYSLCGGEFTTLNIFTEEEVCRRFCGKFVNPVNFVWRKVCDVEHLRVKKSKTSTEGTFAWRKVCDVDDHHGRKVCERKRFVTLKVCERKVCEI